MPNVYDIAYALGIGVAAPLWLLMPKARRKVLKAFRERMAPVATAASGPVVAPSGPAVMIHAVSLGEINATRALVDQLSAARPELRFIVSTTTETGYSRGLDLYAAKPHVELIRYPLDFSSAINRVLDRHRPSLIVLMELEVWPNFVLQCHRRRIPVLLVNGRLTGPSFRGYRYLRPLLSRTFGRLAAVCAQEQAYADRFVAFGAPAERVRVTGTMKFDTAQVADAIPGAADLAAAVGLDASQPTWACGSTGPGEEALILRVYRRLLGRHPSLRLVLVPRHPQRFDDVAALIQREEFPLVRRSETISTPPAADTLPRPSDNTGPNPQSKITNPQSPPVVLGDTMGELRKFYSLADVVFVGRTLVDLGPRQHGSDMIEPAALAKPVIVGPFTGNFAEVMNAFRSADAMVEVHDADALEEAVSTLLSDRSRAAEMGRRAQDIVHRQQGATARHVELILQHLTPATST